MRENEYLLRKESFFINADLKTETNSFNKIPCKIYLPERTNEKPKIIIKPLQNNAEILTRTHKVSLEAQITGFSDEIEVIVRSPEVYIKDAKTYLWGKDLTDCTIYCEPENLEVIKSTGSKEKEITVMQFWISSNSFITPLTMSVPSFNGEIRRDNHKDKRYLIGNYEYNFVERFKYKTEDNGDLTQWRFLVAECETVLNAIDTKEIKNVHIQDLDDFLLLTSFASKHRTVCMGWEAYDGVHESNFYRGYYTFPEVRKQRFNENLIDTFHFDDFIKVAINSFQKYDNKISIRASIHSIISSIDTTLEKGFLSLFAALEALILEFRRNNNLEFILGKDDWDDLRGTIEKSIKISTKPALNAQQRDSIYSKLAELNRVSLREAFEQFCAHYSIPNRDLWPLFGDKEQAGLSEIRNCLIHGDPFPIDLLQCLAIAKIHIEILLDRSLLRIFNWDVYKSKVGSTCFHDYVDNVQEHITYGKKIKKFLIDSRSKLGSENT